MSENIKQKYDIKIISFEEYAKYSLQGILTNINEAVDDIMLCYPEVVREDINVEFEELQGFVRIKFIFKRNLSKQEAIEMENYEAEKKKVELNTLKCLIQKYKVESIDFLTGEVNIKQD